MSQPEFQSEFKLIAATFSTNRGGNEYIYDITRSIIEFEIYEHLDKSYLTSKFVIENSENVFEAIDFQGTEKISIEVQSTEVEDVGLSIIKTFVASKMEKAIRPNENSEVIFIQAYEDIAFKSNLLNINKCYTGNITSIVSRIFTEYLDKSVIASNVADQSQIKVIVPNMTPIVAAQWIKNRATTSDGLPFYFYSTFARDEIFLTDLGSILREKIVNEDYPYLYYQSASQQINSRSTPILNYNYENVEDTLKLIKNGVIGAQYTFIDTFKNTNDVVNFNITKDAIKKLQENDYLGSSKRPIHNESIFDGISIDQYVSKNISVVSSSGAYTSENYSINSLLEENASSNQKKRLIGNSIRNMITKSPISIIVHGQQFIRGDNQYTIGNKARLIFIDTDRPMNDDVPLIDTKKSGDYVIYAAKHVFSIKDANKINTSLLCAKISSFNFNVTIKDFIS